MAPSPKTTRNLYTFRKTHEGKFRLRLRERESVSGAVKAVVCRFCVMFDCEDTTGTMRKATGRSKYFEMFWTDQYIQHLPQKHSQKSSEYAILDGLQDSGA
jgi:hypothetical protein